MAGVFPDAATVARHAVCMARWKAQSYKKSKTVPKGVLYTYAVPEDDDVEEKGYEQPTVRVPGLDGLFANTDKEVDRLMKLYRL